MTTIHPPRLQVGSAVRLRSRLLTVFLALHGLGHFAGTSGSLQLIDQGKTADYLAGFWVVSDPTTLRILAVAWAATGVAFLVFAAMVWGRAGRARLALVAVASVSLALSVAALWAAIVGVVINTVLLILAAAVPRMLLADRSPWSANAHGGRR
jgi:hypothetical protein